MDELALLRQFRLEDTVADDARAHARGVVAAARAHQRTRMRYVVGLAFVAAALLAGAAYGIVHELVVGDPAPPEVVEQLARFGQSADLIPYQRPDAPETKGLRVVAVLDSSVGRAYLFGDADGKCAHAWIEGDRGYQGRLNMSGVCGSDHEGFWSFGRGEFRGHRVGGLLSGRAGDGVARVAVRVDGREVTVPLVDRWFFAEFAEDPTALLTYGTDGRLVREFDMSFRPGPIRPVAQPRQVGAAREVLRVEARGGTQVVTLEVARASDGGNCMIVRSAGMRTNRGCGMPTPGRREIGVAPMQYGGAPTGIQLLVGPVGADVERLQVRYQDGRVDPVAVKEGWALYEVEPADYAEGRRPAELIGLDDAGEVVARKRLPWADP